MQHITDQENKNVMYLILWNCMNSRKYRRNKRFRKKRTRRGGDQTRYERAREQLQSILGLINNFGEQDMVFIDDIGRRIDLRDILASIRRETNDILAMQENNAELNFDIIDAYTYRIGRALEDIHIPYDSPAWRLRDAIQSCAMNLDDLYPRPEPNNRHT